MSHLLFFRMHLNIIISTNPVFFSHVYLLWLFPCRFPLSDEVYPIKNNLQTTETLFTICNESSVLPSRSPFNFNFLWSFFRANNETYVKCTTKSVARHRIVNTSSYNCGTFFLKLGQIELSDEMGICNK